VGNGAWDQRQLDVYGELLGAARLLADHLGGLLPSARRFLVQAADAAAARWREQDQGIWEVRGGPRDFLYSKLMCWAALDCAISLADQLGAAERVAAWQHARSMRCTLAQRMRCRYRGLLRFAADESAAVSMSHAYSSPVPCVLEGCERRIVAEKSRRRLCRTE
jgi:Glycosyl hydrolases family 15